MHLKSLTLKGFKSFAQATTFAFEPGVTCIVGPNGSGKSNVVDALAWVMGEQGAKNLRGGTMADVIFAGTATRGPLGRAEVVLTIDNADGALPIEYGEVAIARTLFRDGRSEYAINGESCRLLDVQELLSDSGLGREMHVIVGQGRLDAVLRATPDERRGFIEEAAGILKHRRRKERTLRKLEAMQANLTRLTDLAEELRRQLKPLGAQAEIAREAATIQAAVREARVRLLAHDAARLGASVAALEAERDTIGARRQVAEDTQHSLARRVAQLEQVDGGELDGARRTALELESVQERMRALAQSTATRAALLAPEEAEPTPAATPMDEVRRSAAAIEGLRSRSAAADATERAIAGQLASAQAALDAVDARIAAQAAAVGEHDRALARLASRVAAAESRLQSAWSDAERRRTTAAAAESRAADAARALAEAPEAAEPHEHPGAADDSGLAEAIAAAEAAQAEVHRLERAQSAAEARLAALRAATAAPPTTAEVLAALPGSRRVQDTLEVDDGWSTAIAAALGPLLEAALLPDGDLRGAADRVAPLGAVDLVDGRGAPVAAVAAPPGALRAADVVRAPPSVLALLGAVLLVDDDAAAPAVLAAAPPGASVVTRSGATFAAARLRTPGAAAGGVELTAQREATADEVEALAGRLIAARDVAARAGERVRSARAASRAAAAERLERDRVARAEGQRRATLAARSESAAAEARRLAQQAAEAQAALAAAAAAGDAAERELVAMRDAERPALDAAERPAAAAALQALQERSVAVRLESGTAHERLRAEQARLAALERRAEEAERATAAAARRAALRRMQRQAVEEVLAVLPAWQASVDASVTAAGVRLAEAERQRAAAMSELADGRRHLAAARDELTELDRGAREVDMRLYEQQLSRAAVLERAEAELGLAEAALAGEADPALDRGAEERRLSAAERQLARLGRVNPLALEEFRALEQRHAFLGEQLADLQRTRTDLLRIVDDLDERIATIFAAAYADTEAAFATIFPVLFPGGTGRLTLTSADDTGVPGVEVAVRPAGKKIERLSLLSGGERSLAAVAFLLAIFTARPSPFYILDEVEAALDDANLGRLLEVIGSLRDASQLILITHQKRTMEIADSLYGVSMRQDGISTVIGQRLQRLTTADA